MATAKEIKRRIKSIKNTSKITKAMELISTVKMKKAQEMASAKKEYVRGMMNVFLNVSDSLQDSIYFKHSIKTSKTLCIVITSNKGLCGGYNINIIKKINLYSKEHKDEQLDFITVGKRGMQFVGRTGNQIIADFSQDFTDNITNNFSKTISEMIREKFTSGEYDKVQVFYTHFINTIKQIGVSHTILPISKIEIENYFKQVIGESYYDEKDNIKNISNKSHYVLEPSKEELLDIVIPMILDSLIFDIIIESKASEHSSRMIAMKNAKDSANKFASKLTMSYNKARQGAITKEVSEIVSGVESMKEV